MLIKLIRFLRGYVTFKIIGHFPERFINLSLKNGIGLFDVLPVNDCLTACALITDYRTIRTVARRSGVRLKIVKRSGLPFINHRFRHRWAIAVGMIVFIIASLVLQCFVWTVEINGVETLSVAELTSSLQNSGVYSGAFKGGLDLHKLERELLMKYEEIGWISINLIGTRMEVEIKEKEPVPQIEYSQEYHNIKAAKDGIIIACNVKRGTLQVKTGSAVCEGQVLVSGIYENSLGEKSFVDADADIIARTQYSFTATADETASYWNVGEKTQRSRLKLLWFDFPLSLKSEKFDSSLYTQSLQLYIFDCPVPIVLRNQRMCIYEPNKRQLSRSEALTRLDTELTLYKIFTLEGVSSVATEKTFTKDNFGYTLNAHIVCTEKIGVKEKFIVNSQ